MTGGAASAPLAEGTIAVCATLESLTGPSHTGAMTLQLNPYINLRGTAREALEFYRSVLGGDLAITAFSEFPDMAPPGEEHLVMHGQLTTADGLVLMVSDVPSTMEYAAPTGFSVSVSGDEAERLQEVWDGLADGGAVTAPYTTPPWGGTFGMLTDRFGVVWMILCDESTGEEDGPTVES